MATICQSVRIVLNENDDYDNILNNYATNPQLR